MKQYHLRSNPIVHGDKVSHHPNNTGILVNLMGRWIKAYRLRRKHKKEFNG